MIVKIWPWPWPKPSTPAGVCDGFCFTMACQVLLWAARWLASDIWWMFLVLQSDFRQSKYFILGLPLGVVPWALPSNAIFGCPSFHIRDVAKIFEPSVSDNVSNGLVVTKCLSDCLVSDFVNSCDLHDFAEADHLKNLQSIFIRFLESSCFWAKEEDGQYGPCYTVGAFFFLDVF